MVICYNSDRKLINTAYKHDPLHIGIFLKSHILSKKSSEFHMKHDIKVFFTPKQCFKFPFIKKFIYCTPYHRCGICISINISKKWCAMNIFFYFKNTVLLSNPSTSLYQMNPSLRDK